jgi:Gpi18-like mannosyltransferase
MVPGALTERWSRRHFVVLGIAIVAGILIRVALLSTSGLQGDLDQFVLWVHGIAVNGLGNAYDQNLSFPPVMAYLWGLLAALEPAFRTVSDSSDLSIRVLMKIPAVLADVGLALLLAYALRSRPWWAVIAATVVMLHPAVIDVSAWWGQYESIYLLSGLAAVVFAVNGRNVFAAVALAVCLMTKPQALPFLLPFAAWFWAHGGIREVARTAVTGLAVIVALWLPFMAAGGPLDYLHSLADYQNDVFPILSLNAWNVWWLVQIAAVGGFAGDQIAVIGPLTFRHLGFILTGLVSVVVAILIVRDPRPRTLILGLAASTLVWYGLLTQMHERYAYGAVIFLLLLIPERRIQWLCLGLGVVFTLSLWSAAPPAPAFAAWLPFGGPWSVAGAIAMMLFCGLTIIWMTGGPERGSDAPENRQAGAG